MHKKEFIISYFKIMLFLFIKMKELSIVLPHFVIKITKCLFNNARKLKILKISIFENEEQTKNISNGIRKIDKSKMKKVLEDWYQANIEHPYATKEEILELSLKTALEEKTIRRWFDNKRSRSTQQKPKKGFDEFESLIFLNHKMIILDPLI